MDGDSSAPPPFLIKTYDMVDDPSTNSIVSWSSTESSFIVWKPLEFARDLLPKYFKHKNFSSFVRQLNTYGFRKIDPEQWEFANEEFIRGQRQLLKNIHRRKPIYSHSLQHLQAQGNSPGGLAESEKQELEEEIVRLKQEKGMLVVELQRHTQQQQGMDLQMQSLEKSLRNMERRQRQMMAFLSYIIQKPGFVSNFAQQSGNHNKKRRWPNPDYFFQEHDMHGDRDVSIQTREEQDVLPMRVINTEPFEKMELSINSWENFLCGVSYASGEMYGRGMHRESSCLLLTEIIASSGDLNGNLLQSPMLDTSFPHSRDVDSSPELAESSYVETPSLSVIQTKTSVIDINSKPPGTEVHCSIKRVNGASAGPTKANDGFWEQFLTETPGSSDTQEVQSERRDNEVKNNQRKNCGLGIFGWNKKNLDHLTEQMGQLSPAERKTNVG